MRSTLLCWCAVLMAFLWLGVPPVAAVDRTQVLPLSYGWNAVWMEVTPRNPDGSTVTADQVFATAESDPFVIDQIAVASEAENPKRFVTHPANTTPQVGWLLWKRSPGSGETDSILAQRPGAFLVRVVPRSGTVQNGTQAGTLRITGRTSFQRPSWNRDRFSLVGFGIEGGVTFTDLLGAAGWTTSAENPKAFRLDPATGQWVPVGSTDPVVAGQAYWISLPFQLPDTRYAGPIGIDFNGALLGRLDFGRGPGATRIENPSGGGPLLPVSTAELTLTRRNQGAAANVQGVTLSRILPTAAQSEAAAEMPLFRLERVPGQLQWRATPTGSDPIWELGTVAPGTSQSVTFGLSRNWIDNAPREHLYQLRVRVGSGAIVFDLPVVASGNGPVGLGSNPTSTATLPGLWMGTIAIDQVTSLTATNGQPVVPTESTASIRILIHVGTNGVPVLLSRVLLMQTRAADPSVASTPVLVLSESQIPFFEGIEERGGKKVGVRFESAFFDLPRDWRPTAQRPELLLEIQQTLNLGSSPVVATNLFDFLAAQPSRPPQLNEAYWDRWPLEGTWAPGGGARTPADAPLLLDPFHRSNPFRHAFHRQHGAGYPIRRAFVLSLDNQPFQGELTGTFEETISGLATADLVYRGKVSLQRLSDVTDLR